MSGQVAVSIHDVAPATWRRCERLLALVERLGAGPVTLLVVPHFHHGQRIDRVPGFVRAVERRLANGDEIVLHGWCHVDEAPPPRTPSAWFRRRVMTRGEGEFAAISRADACARLQQGAALWHTLGWPIGGFVPPAWLLGPKARAGFKDSRVPFRYLSLRRHVVRLPEWSAIRTASIAYSPDSAPRRALARLLIAHELAGLPPQRLLRIALHPRDAEEPRVLAHVERLLRSVLLTRTPVTELGWLDGFETFTTGPRSVQRKVA